MTEFVDIFADPFWDYVRSKASEESILMRDQGFVEPSCSPAKNWNMEE